MERSKLHLLDKDMTYTLSTERTTTKLFIVGYEKTMNRELTEIPLQELISRFAFTY